MTPFVHAAAGLMLCAALCTFAPDSDRQEKQVEPPADAAAAHTIEDLAFIAGSWETAGGKTTMDETWSHPSGGAMLGTGRVVSGGKMKFFEFLRIETRAGRLVYVAQPGGGPGTVFQLTKLEKGHAVFENEKHDFPKKITYRLDDEGGLTTRIEGDGTEREKPQEFRFKRRVAR